MAKIKTSLFERESKNLKVLRNEAKECKNCDLWKNGTQTVFGKGVNDAKIMIREQPGNQEDLQGQTICRPRRRTQFVDDFKKVAKLRL